MSNVKAIKAKRRALKARNLVVIDFPSNGGRDASIFGDVTLRDIDHLVVAVPIGVTEAQTVERLTALIEFIKCNQGDLWDEGNAGLFEGLPF